MGLPELISMGSITEEGAEILRKLVAEKKKLVIGFVARDAVARRLPGLLRELIPVLDVETVSRC